MQSCKYCDYSPLSIFYQWTKIHKHINIILHNQCIVLILKLVLKVKFPASHGAKQFNYSISVQATQNGFFANGDKLGLTPMNIGFSSQRKSGIYI